MSVVGWRMRRSEFFFSFSRRAWVLADRWFYFNFISTLEGSVIQVSEQGLRKALYQKVRCSSFSLALRCTWADDDDDGRSLLRSQKAGYRQGRYRETVCCLFFSESGVGADVVPVISSECNEEEVREGGDGARIDMIIRGLSEKIFASGGWRLSWCRFPDFFFCGGSISPTQSLRFFYTSL